MHITNWLEEFMNYYFYRDSDQIAPVLELIMKELWGFTYNGCEKEYCERLQNCLERIMIRNKEREMEEEKC